MADFIKKQGVGIWISIGTVLVSIIALIIYGAALGGGTDLLIADGSELFYETARETDSAMMTTVVTCGVLALVFLAIAIVLAQFEFDGIVGTVCNVITGALRIAAPALILCAFLYFVYGSFTGLGWTFFSNAELEIYPQAITVGKQVITGAIFFAIAGVAGVVAAFFGMRKKQAQ